jgi:hypothetical protein
MVKVTTIKKSKGIIRLHKNVADFADFDIDVIQNVDRRELRLMQRGALIKAAPLEFEGVVDLGQVTLGGLDSVLQNTIAVRLSRNVGDALLPAVEVFAWADNLTPMRDVIVDVLAGIVDIREADLEERIDEIENM